MAIRLALALVAGFFAGAKATGVAAAVGNAAVRYTAWEALYALKGIDNDDNHLCDACASHSILDWDAEVSDSICLHLADHDNVGESMKVVGTMGMMKVGVVELNIFGLDEASKTALRDQWESNGGLLSLSSAKAALEAAGYGADPLSVHSESSGSFADKQRVSFTLSPKCGASRLFATTSGSPKTPGSLAAAATGCVAVAVAAFAALQVSRRVAARQAALMGVSENVGVGQCLCSNVQEESQEVSANEA